MATIKNNQSQMYPDSYVSKENLAAEKALLSDVSKRISQNEINCKVCDYDKLIL
jgi:hypothetical protein